MKTSMNVTTPQIRIALTAAVLAVACSAARPKTEEPTVTPLQPTSSSPAPVASNPERARPTATQSRPILRAPFGEVAGQEVALYTLQNPNGMLVKVMTYGAAVTELHVPDRAGKFSDVVLGFDTLDDYVKGGSLYFGASVGRVANRIRNAKFKLGGKEYSLTVSDKPHHLHGGTKGWDKVVWAAQATETPEGPQVRLSYVSKDGEQGYPGTVHATSTYTLTNNNELRIEMTATTDKTTIVNMVHHSYWNLAGHDSGSIADHELTLFADKYTPGDPQVPTGAVLPVKGTPFDFTIAKRIGKDLERAGGKPIGFDHNFIVNGEPNALRPVARLRDPQSGRVLTIEADQPGVQLYTGNFLDGTKNGKAGTAYPQYAGLCLETQKFPNAINVPAWRDQVVLEPGQTYRHTMVLRFTAD